MKKLCALLALIFVLSLAGGVFGQDSRDRGDDQRRSDDRDRRDSSRSYQENARRRHHRHHKHYSTDHRDDDRH